MSAPGTTTLTETQAMILRALVDLDRHTPGGMFRAPAVKRRAGGVPFVNWQKQLHELSEATPAEQLVARAIDDLNWPTYSVTRHGRDALAAHDAAQKARRS